MIRRRLKKSNDSILRRSGIRVFGFTGNGCSNRMQMGFQNGDLRCNAAIRRPKVEDCSRLDARSHFVVSG